MTPEERLKISPKAPRPDLDIDKFTIAERDGVIFMNKPWGWASTGRTLADEDCVQHALMQHKKRMVWAAHQLDGDTSGLNVFVQKKSLVPQWQKRLHFPQAQKEYLAIVHGQVDKAMKLDQSIGKRPDGSWGVYKEGKKSLTLVYPVLSTQEFSLVRIHLRTGRTHQVRVHMSDAGHPLVGEFWYNEQPCTLAERHMLHAFRTRFDAQQDPAVVIAAVPEDMLEVAQRLGVSIPAQIDGHSPLESRVILHEENNR